MLELNDQVRFRIFERSFEMPTDDDQEMTAERFKDLLGAPRFVRGESVEDYWKWWFAFVQEHKPKTLSNWLEVNDLANKHWEQDRLRRCNSAILDGVRVSALQKLLTPFHAIDLNAVSVARDYYAEDNKEGRTARAKVLGCGITDDHILAEAMEMRRDALLLLDRMDSHRSNSRRLLLKDLDRRANARLALAPEQPADADNESIP
jgi:hypothetical protein